MAQSKVARLSVYNLLNLKRIVEIEINRQHKTDASQLNIALVFLLVELDFHTSNCSNKYYLLQVLFMLLQLLLDLTTVQAQAYINPVAAKSAAGFDILNSERTGAHSKRFFCARVMAGRVWALRSAAPRSGMSTCTACHPLFDINSGSSQFSEGTTMSQSAIQAFNFAAALIRTILINDEPWFVAADVCKILGLNNPTRALATLDQDEKLTLTLGKGQKTTLDSIEGQRSRGGAQKLNIVNESGLYALIFKSRKPVAKKFRKWVTNDVLPEIRKTGNYSVTSEPRQSYEKITSAQYAEISSKIHFMASGWLWSESTQQHIHNKIRVLTNVHRLDTIPADQFDDMMTGLDDLNASMQLFMELMIEMRETFKQQIIIDGAPWTPDIKRKWKKQYTESLPERPDWVAIQQKMNEQQKIGATS